MASGRERTPSLRGDAVAFLVRVDNYTFPSPLPAAQTGKRGQKMAAMPFFSEPPSARAAGRVENAERDGGTPAAAEEPARKGRHSPGGGMLLGRGEGAAPIAPWRLFRKPASGGISPLFAKANRGLTPTAFRVFFAWFFCVFVCPGVPLADPPPLISRKNQGFGSPKDPESSGLTPPARPFWNRLSAKPAGGVEYRRAYAAPLALRFTPLSAAGVPASKRRSRPRGGTLAGRPRRPGSPDRRRRGPPV
jgi:hypothetical protein